MYLKWIICDVNANLKQAFSIAQTKWNELQNIDGFIAQFGGWNTQNSTQACLVSLWRNKQSLTSFMNNEHDVIFNKIEQKYTYFKSNIQHFSNIFLINKLDFNIFFNLHKLSHFQVTNLHQKSILKNKLTDLIPKLNMNESFFNSVEKNNKMLYLPILDSSKESFNFFENKLFKVENTTTSLENSWIVLRTKTS